MCGLPSSHDRGVDDNFKSEHIHDIEKYITIRSSFRADVMLIIGFRSHSAVVE